MTSQLSGSANRSATDTDAAHRANAPFDGEGEGLRRRACIARC